MLTEIRHTCSLCGSNTPLYLFVRHGAKVFRCEECGLTWLDETTAPAPAGATSAGRLPADTLTNRRAAEGYVRAMARRGAARSRMLLVGDDGPFAAAAEAAGFTIASRQAMDAIERDGVTGGPYGSAVVLFQLERAADATRALQLIHGGLAPGAVLLLVTPVLSEWRRDNRWQFDMQTIQSFCLRSGFAELEFSPPVSSIVITARRVQPPPRPVLSIVMPAFNERATFEQTLNAVLEKDCAGVDKEIVIVESNSTDGTRELVRKYEGRPGVTVILEDRPRGKGAAVRTGLARATGTLVLIQDADSEYDVNDYDALLEPLLTYRRAFVLGSRHMGRWKMRKFADQPGISAFFNFGHVLFRSALNVIYRQHIKDPFTMYKVFRRDCLHGLKLECNRFDFDFELVIKLLRKGYVPLEVPVNYASRSFRDGKKVSAWRDPLTWIRALVKYRFASIYDERQSPN